MDRTGDVAVIIPAKNEADRVAATVGSALRLPGVDRVIVVDDGSTDGTGGAARAAGAHVIRHDRTSGKAGAMESGAEAAALLECSAGAQGQARHLLFLDADLGASASAASSLIEPVRAGTADMTVALFPVDRARGGGHGFVVKFSRSGIRHATGWDAGQPLNGQRCLTREAFESARPLASGFGVETALTIDLINRGMRIEEVEVDISHRVTGSDWRGQLHRGRQFLDVGRALVVRELRARRRHQDRSSIDVVDAR